MLTNVTFADSQKPVTRNATPEAVELLEFIYSLSGDKILSGQHDYPMSGPFYSRYVHKMTGKYPALVGRDFGFSEPGTLDGVNYRQGTIDNLIQSHHEGYMITLMWHATPPTMQEPVNFSDGVQSDLTDAEWDALITPGSDIHERWKSQVDGIAPYLRQLQYEGVPVLWRPYHEMNGGWFWWGGRGGENGYKKLYRMLYDRLVNFHDLKNLIWVFNGNQVSGNVKPYADFYPGNDVVDILATDVYQKYVDSDYDDLLELGKGKPIALGEVGPFPTTRYLDTHPKWVWFMSWSEFLLKPDRKDVVKLYGDDRVLTLDELKVRRK